jgi:ABC-type glycerol-3-phosphate transport system substrate-binding protein
MKRANWLNVLASVALLAALTACAGSATPTTSAVKETVPVQQTVIVTAPANETVVYNSFQSDTAPRAAEEQLLKMFKAENPTVDVTYSVVAHEDFKQAIRAYLTASTPPDVMTWFSGERASFFIDKGLIMDISDLYQQQGWNQTFPKGFVALATYNDKQYAVPNSYYWWAVYYNKTVFAKYNLTPPKTWDEFLKVCDTLKTNGVTPIAIGTKAPWTAAGWFDYLDMRINGPDYHLKLLRKGAINYNDPGVKKVFTTWKDLLDKGYFMPNAASYAWEEAVPALTSGKAGMYLMGQFIMDAVPDANKADIDFFRFPIIDPSVPIGEDAPTDIYWAAANAPHPEAAKKFLAFLGSKEAQEYWAKTLNRLPVNSEVDPSIFSPQVKQGIELIKGADVVDSFYDNESPPEMAEKGMAAMIQFWTNTDQIDSILDQLTKDEAAIYAAMSQ